MILMFRGEELENHCSVQRRYEHQSLRVVRCVAEILLVN